MRIAVLLCLVVASACSGPVASGPSLSPPAIPTSKTASLATGGIVEYTIPQPATLPSDCFAPCRASLGDMALGPDGNVWFVDAGRSQVGRVTPDGKIVQFPVPSPVGGSRTITAGPDGNVWFTALAAGQDQTDWIVRVTPGGAVTRFPAGSQAHTAPEGITAGPDGNLWFTEVFGNRVSRLTPTGTLTEFAIPGIDHPRGITVGPDGAIWFTSSQAIGRITVQGRVSAYLAGNDPSLPLRDITAGPDGNLWFTQAGAIRHITTDGRTIVNVPVPTGSSPDGLVSGPDGNIWYTDPSLSAILRMSVTGVLREFHLPRRLATPHGIALGSDGRIWFGEKERIGSIGVKVPEAAFSSRVLIYPDAMAQSVTVTNTGDGVLTIAAVKVTGADSSAFAAGADSCSGKSLAPGARCEITVSHTSTGSTSVVQSALLEVADNGTGSPQRVSLVAQLRACKLPVLDSLPNTPAQGSMLDTTTGRELYEPRGGFTSTASPTRVNTVTEPVLAGFAAGYYDRLAGRWLPVSDADSVSPDGTRYAYIPYDDPGATRTLHVVDVATGHERVITMSRGLWVLVAFTERGVYVHQAYEGVGPGLWLVDPDSGAMRQVLESGAVDRVQGSTAWVGDRNPADTLPQWGMGGGSNEVGSKDLVTGGSQTWLYIPGSQMYVIAVYNGAPVVDVADPSKVTYYVVASPNHATPIDLPFTTDDAPYLYGFIPDAQGLWIGSGDGLYLWTARTGGVLVSTTQAMPAGTCA